MHYVDKTCFHLCAAYYTSLKHTITTCLNGVSILFLYASFQISSRRSDHLSLWLVFDDILSQDKLVPIVTVANASPIAINSRGHHKSGVASYWLGCFHPILLPLLEFLIMPLL